VQTINHEYLDGAIVQFEGVLWNPGEHDELERMIAEDSIAQGRRVLQLDAETGLLSILCAFSGAKSVVALNRHDAAVANSRYNAALLDLESVLKVPEQAFTSTELFKGLGEEEKFDLILMDLRRGESIERQIDLLFEGLPSHLAPGGRCLLTCGSQACLSRLEERASTEQRKTKPLTIGAFKELREDNPKAILVELR
ncbi:MAG: hypothetical protein AAF802_33225, partial [Planctomycetota bacterium]